MDVIAAAIEALDGGNLTRLREDYPAWTITVERTRLSAVLPGWGGLYGEDVSELRGRLEQWATDHR